MKTIFISANDTGSGKTFVTAALALHLVQRGQRVQVVKPVETGVTAATPPEATDAGFVAAFVRRHAGDAQAEALLCAHTLLHFSEPMAPVDAALADGQIFSFDALVQHLRDLPTQGVQWRLVEGAGGLAVPLESNHAATPLSSTTPQAENTPRDWSDFACAVGADACVLVVADRLGAINQARLLAAYAVQKQVANCGLWLNAANADTPPAIRASNADALHDGASGVPLLAIHNHNELWPQAANLPWLR